jgi:hypothetical protein
MTREYDLDAREFARKFRAIELARPKAVIRGVASAVLLSAEIVARAAPKDLGNLKRLVRGVVESPGGFVEASAPHAIDVEMGARPHWTPIAPLVAWARRHGAANLNEAFRMAKGIQAKIARFGQAPTYFMRKTLPKQRKVLQAEVGREIALDRQD